MRLFPLLIIPIVLITGCGWSSPPDQLEVTQKVKKILSQPPFSDEEYRRAINLLTEGIEKQPNNTNLILLRARYYTDVGNYKGAQEDVTSVISTGINYPELVMFKCMLIERINGFTEKAQSCYIKVMDKYDNKAQKAETPSVNYVISAFLANDPKAKVLRKKYLNKTSISDPMYPIIKNFSRKTYINNLLP